MGNKESNTATQSIRKGKSMKINLLQADQIKPYWRNPRKNSKAIELVKKSIDRYGFLQPIVIDSNNIIIAGHTRYKAMIELGHQQIPTITADLSPEKAKEYRIVDNKTAELAEWDIEALIPELREIKSIDEIEDYFVGASIEDLLSQGVSNKEINDEDVKKREDQLKGQFEEKSALVQGQYIDILCPHCGESFYLDKSEVNRQPGESDGRQET